MIESSPVVVSIGGVFGVGVVTVSLVAGVEDVVLK